MSYLGEAHGVTYEIRTIYFLSINNTSSIIIYRELDYYVNLQFCHQFR